MNDDRILELLTRMRDQMRESDRRFQHSIQRLREVFNRLPNQENTPSPSWPNACAMSKPPSAD